MVGAIALCCLPELLLEVSKGSPLRPGSVPIGPARVDLMVRERVGTVFTQ
jgi:hypothetical protein